jgi:hypothetical protein
MRSAVITLAILVALGAAGGGPTSGMTAAQLPEYMRGLHRPLDQILDIYVRDGLVYYRALKSDRAKLDGYLRTLDVPAKTYAAWPASDRAAFWLNAYNASVLRTVIDHYPIQRRAAEYPPNSIRQIPGAFEKTVRRLAGRAVTLDQVEKEILPEFKDPRLYLALGRGAIGGGRLRSEAYDGARLEQQLEAVRAEFVTRDEQLRVDMTAGRISVTPVVGWHQQAFIDAYAAKGTTWANRSPIERAVMVFIEPHLFPMERGFIRKNQFAFAYLDFDWRLNDLTGGAR